MENETPIVITITVKMGEEILDSQETKVHQKLLGLREFAFEFTNKVTSLGEKMVPNIQKKHGKN